MKQYIILHVPTGECITIRNNKTIHKYKRKQHREYDYFITEYGLGYYEYNYIRYTSSTRYQAKCLLYNFFYTNSYKVVSTLFGDQRTVVKIEEFEVIEIKEINNDKI